MKQSKYPGKERCLYCRKYKSSSVMLSGACDKPKCRQAMQDFSKEVDKRLNTLTPQDLRGSVVCEAEETS